MFNIWNYDAGIFFKITDKNMTLPTNTTQYIKEFEELAYKKQQEFSEKLHMLQCWVIA